MKKIWKKIAITVSALMVLSLSSCALWEEIKKSVTAPTDEWLETDVSYSYKGNDLNCECYMIYTKEGYTNSKLKNDLVPVLKEEGLTMVIIPEAESDNELLNDVFGDVMDKKYIIKTWKLGDKISWNQNAEAADDDVESENDKGFKMSQGKWNLLHASLKFGAGMELEEDASLPSCLKSTSTWTPLTDLKNFSWKKLLAGILIDSLLE